MTTPPTIAPVAVAQRAALSVDVEEWYHTCLVSDYVHPERRPPLESELDWLLPELLEFFSETQSRGTFFVLGEVAEQFPARIREIEGAGHEIASHGFFHLRVEEFDGEQFRQDVERSKKVLEDLIGSPVLGYRSPEWSLRRFDNPKLRTLAELGFRYDSSLAPYILAGSPENGRDAYRLTWSDSAATLIELPPFTYGGRLRIPAAGWTGRLLSGAWIADRLQRAHGQGRAPVMVVHPWELSDRPTPGRLRGAAGFVHEAGRSGYRRKFRQILERLDWCPLGELLSPENTRRTETDAVSEVPSVGAEESLI